MSIPEAGSFAVAVSGTMPRTFAPGFVIVTVGPVLSMRRPVTTAVCVLPATTGFQAHRLDVERPIDLKGRTIGSVYILSDLSELEARVWEYTKGAIGIILVASLLALALLSRLQGIVSRPILAVVQTARLRDNGRRQLATLGGPDQGRPAVDAIAVDRDDSDFGDPIFRGAEARRFDIDYCEAGERVQSRARSLHPCWFSLSNERSIMSSWAIKQARPSIA